jgi:multiple sugar transport system substrate-binding protein
MAGLRAALSLFSVAIVVLGGCAPSASQRETLRLWAMGREGEVIAQLVPEFERRNPGIHVEVQQVPWTATHEKLLTAFAGDALPDVCQLGNTWIPEFAALDALAPLDAMAASSQIVIARDYFPGIWDTNIVRGRLHGIPWYVDTRVLFYRSDLLRRAGFDHAPGSWDEWKRALAAVKHDAGPSRFAILLPLNEFEPLLALALQQPDPLLRDGGRYGNFASPGFRNALEFYASMFRAGWTPTTGNAEISNVWTEFGRGFFAFYISGPWNIEEFKRRLPPERQGDWMTAPLPGPNGPGTSIAGGSSLVIFRSSRHVQAAWRLIEYLSEPDVQIRFHQLTGDLPPRRTAWQNGHLADDVYAKAFLDQLERVQPAPKVPEWERIANAMQLMAEQVVSGRIGIDDATRALDREVDAILEKRRWMLARSQTP